MNAPLRGPLIVTAGGNPCKALIIGCDPVHPSAASRTRVRAIFSQPGPDAVHALRGPVRGLHLPGSATDHGPSGTKFTYGEERVWRCALGRGMLMVMNSSRSRGVLVAERPSPEVMSSSEATARSP
ncbi:hypothetical protein ACGFI9_27835 [Micromonospora sp. NPDC048930]|uniref:hypothetical protein n=1 Tax=Micromonospora sp. NPDC048930 TaxID=3364261 RepID=UPI0037165A6F